MPSETLPEATVKHTPGPWRVSPLDGRTCGPSRLLISNGTEVSQLQAVAIVTLRTGETDANARLIAAAPDLLDACRMAHAALRHYQEHLNAGQFNSVEDKDAIDYCADAIAKAEGR